MDLFEEDQLNLNRRKADFDAFYDGLLPELVEFAGHMGFDSPHLVLNEAPRFADGLDQALRDLAIESSGDRVWLLLRVGYFVGEYFVQTYGGYWFVNDIAGSRYFARYVVGGFRNISPSTAMLDPFLIAQEFVDTPVPRSLSALIASADGELRAMQVHS